MPPNPVLLSKIIYAVVIGIIVFLLAELFFGLPFQGFNVIDFFALLIVAMVLSIVRILLRIKTKSFKFFGMPSPPP